MIRWTHSLRTMALVGVAALLCVGCPPAVDGPDEVSRKKVVVHADPPRRRPVPVPVTPQADVRGEADVFVDAEEEPGERPPYLDESPVVVGEDVPELSDSRRISMMGFRKRMNCGPLAFMTEPISLNGFPHFVVFVNPVARYSFAQVSQPIILMYLTGTYLFYYHVL